ncbi:molybdopterin converting factor subunit 1 [Aquibacillus halophilus]|uniref:Molybdopterin synthase sulfur carrier subunit n=1 Tax=Aquibacillus halophilus TaxID=930132 RepID=A0A6A8DHN3_9BACI|nr:molybdopterin converting factor subunit 1 [Aquibacillus halophilus]MRH44740.1 molybdopterin converting factor subunit 1 [Aquibacillus halophilus]
MINVLLFAHLQEEAGQDRLEIDEEGMRVDEFKQMLEDRYKFTQLDQVMVAINEEFAFNNDLINSGDTVALIPPVSGG